MSVRFENWEPEWGGRLFNSFSMLRGGYWVAGLSWGVSIDWPTVNPTVSSPTQGGGPCFYKRSIMATKPFHVGSDRANYHFLVSHLFQGV